MKKLLIYLIILFSFISCSKNEYDKEVPLPVTNSADIDFVFNKAQNCLCAVKGPETKALNNSIESYYSIDSGSEAKPLYMVNFSNNGGSVLISSDYRDGYTAYLISENNTISAEELSDTDSPIALYCNLIQDYRANTIYPETKSKDYTVEETIISNTGVGPLLTTTWHQDSPFNYYLFEADPEHTYWPMGCGPVAVAQILQFHNYPSNYGPYYFNWDDINKVKSILDQWNYVDETYEVSKLIYAVGKAVNVRYTTDNGVRVGSCSPIDLKNGVSTLGYNYSFGAFSISNALLSLDSNLPILTIGEDSQRSDVHAWVIDGYRNTVIATRSYDDDGNLISSTELDDNAFDTTSKYLHVNYGWGNSEYKQYYNAIDRLNGEVYIYWTTNLFSYHNTVTDENNNNTTIHSSFDSNIQCFYNLTPQN